ncbi:MAG: hypothetical protein HY431_01600 [Candidatus Levybacteria bacterium]|nr:hypothetical protein [Candidatus Levybacteria bacterium]
MAKEDLISYLDQLLKKKSKTSLSRGQADLKPVTPQAETTASGAQPKQFLADIDALTRHLFAGDTTERVKIREAASTLLTPKTTKVGATREYTGDELIEYGILQQNDIWTNRSGNSRVVPQAIDKLYRLLDALYNAQLTIRAVDESGRLTASHLLQYRYQGALPYTVALYLEPELRYRPNPAFLLLPKVELRLPKDTFGEDLRDFVPFPTDDYDRSLAKSMSRSAGEQTGVVRVTETSLYEHLPSPEATGPAVFAKSINSLPQNIVDRLREPSYHTDYHIN